MNCADAPEWTAVGSLTIGLTELALVEAHLRRCVECRNFSSPRPTPPPPEPAASLAAQRSHFGALVETARAGAGARDVLPDLRARIHATFSMLLPPPARLMWLGPLATLAIYAGHSALHPRAESPIDAGGELMLAAVPAESSSAVAGESPAPVDAELEMKSATSSTIERSMADQSESRALPEIESGVPSGAVSVERAEPEMRRAADPPEPASAPAQGVARPLAHVAGQLSVKNRSVAERDLTDLLARTGGTVVGTDQDGDI